MYQDPHPGLHPCDGCGKLYPDVQLNPDGEKGGNYCEDCLRVKWGKVVCSNCGQEVDFIDTFSSYKGLVCGECKAALYPYGEHY